MRLRDELSRSIEHYYFIESGTRQIFLFYGRVQ